MAIIKHFLILIVTCFTLSAGCLANDSVRVSLLTCSPGNEVYELYGHTAIRYCDLGEGVDMAFNYGMFSFNAPNFVMRFVKGETDYQLGVVPFDLFMREYLGRGSTVTEQTLNLTDAEKQRLFELLKENYRFENRTYRYNFFYDNCTTRARDKIEEAVDGRITYAKLADGVTFRDIIHEFNGSNLWSRLGIDFCLGAGADEQISDRQKMFAPFYMLKAADRATVTDSVGKKRSLVLATEVYSAEKSNGANAEMEGPFSFLEGPFFFSLLLLLLTAVMVVAGRKWNVALTVYEAMLFTLQAVAGCIVAFLFFFSSHPTVDTNWLVWVFNPLPFLFLILLIAGRRWTLRYHYVNMAVVGAFVAFFYFIPQKFGIEILFLAMNLLILSVNRVITDGKKQK